MRMRAGRDNAGESIRWASGESELGWVLVARGAGGVRAILLGDTRESVERDARERFPGSRRGGADAELAAAVADAVALVELPSAAFEHELDPRGTPFQRRVWRALLEVPAGATTTYAALAARIGAPRAVRAVGTACGANPIAVAVPCHRALRGDGSLAGYRWGLGRKRELLRRESAISPERAA